MRPKEPNWTAWANDVRQCGCWMAEATDKFAKCLVGLARSILGKKHHEPVKAPRKMDELVIRLGRSPVQRCVNHISNRIQKFRLVSEDKCWFQVMSNFKGDWWQKFLHKKSGKKLMAGGGTRAPERPWDVTATGSKTGATRYLMSVLARELVASGMYTTPATGYSPLNRRVRTGKRPQKTLEGKGEETCCGWSGLIWSSPDGEIRRYDSRLNIIVASAGRAKLCSAYWLSIRVISGRGAVSAPATILDMCCGSACSGSISLTNGRYSAISEKKIHITQWETLDYQPWHYRRFCALSFADASFSMVVLDPPHLSVLVITPGWERNMDGWIKMPAWWFATEI